LLELLNLAITPAAKHLVENIKNTGGIAFGWHGVAMDLDGMGRQWIWMAWDSIQWHCCPMQCHPMPSHPNPLPPNAIPMQCCSSAMPPNAIPMQCGVGIGAEHLL
jgi:hypothetical protein